MVASSPFVLVVFGATGDLMARKIMPALYRLVEEKHIASTPYLIGVGRRAVTNDEFQSMMKSAVKDSRGKECNESLWKDIASRISYEQGFFEDARLYKQLVTVLTHLDDQMNACIPRFFYLATPPEHYETILTSLQTSKLSEGCGQNTPEYTRILIEKPFGKDLRTAQELEKLLGRIFSEKQIYRIDHYLDKQSVQNILALRFANGIFEPTWNSKFIDHVQIALLESIPVSPRGAFYDGVGAIRDVVQNHMLQMLAFVAMDQPKAFDSENLRAARRKVIESILPIEPTHVSSSVVTGQYEGYRKETNIDPQSRTETYAALKLFLDTSRWRDVPFYLRTGKRLKEKVTEVSLHFKKPVVCTGPLCLFPEPQVMRNVLVIRISPDTGMGLRLMAKKPGLGMDLTSIEMSEHKKDETDAHGEYEKLLLDAIRGDQTLFAHSSEVEASWRFVTKILDGFSSGKIRPFQYQSGTWGPKEANDFIERDLRHWYTS